MAAPKGNKHASKFDMDIVYDVCLLVEDGMNVKAALKTNDKFPSFNTWCRWKRENPHVRDLYINAIQDKSESVIEEMDDISMELRSGKIDASTANVLIQTLKWKAAKFYPKMFGDNKQVDLTTKGDKINNVLTAEEARKQADELDEEY